MLNAIRYARENRVPYFGICLGMQTACIEFARNVFGLRDANSSRIRSGRRSIGLIYKLRETAGRGRDGRHHAARRVDLYSATGFFWPARAYSGATEISERHRHRFEFNREYEALLTGGGLQISGTTPDSTYVEIVGDPRPSLLPGLPSSTQSSALKPFEPHPLFREFIAASHRNRAGRFQTEEPVAEQLISSGGRSS